LTLYVVAISFHIIQQWDGEWLVKDPNGKYFVLLNKVDKGYHAAGTTLKIRMMGKFSGSTPPTATAEFTDLTGDTQTVPPIHIPSGMHIFLLYDIRFGTLFLNMSCN
jgi:hypothetical protein